MNLSQKKLRDARLDKRLTQAVVAKMADTDTNYYAKIGETYLIGANGEKNNLEVFKMILEILGKDDSWLEHVKDRPGHDLRYAIDANDLGWSPKFTDFRLGLKETIKWYEENASWWKSQKDLTELKYKEIAAK